MEIGVRSNQEWRWEGVYEHDKVGVSEENGVEG